MSDTPETDAAVNASGGDWSPVLRETCRRLERERDAYYSKAMTNAGLILDARAECDEALSVADTLSGIASAYLGWHLSRTPHGADDRSLEVARNVTAAIKRWKELKR